MIHSARHHGHDNGRTTGPADAREDRARRLLGLLKKPPRSAGVALAAAIGLAAVWLVLSKFQDQPSLPRHPADFPSPPKLESLIAAASAQLKDNPQDLAALVRLGVLHFEKGKASYVDAINELEEARSMGAMDARIFYCLGIMYQELGLYPYALEEYQRFLRNHPRDKEVRMLLAKLLYHEARHREAADEYERLRFSFPQDSLIEENLGLSLLKVKDYPRAAESFAKLQAAGGEAARRAIYYGAQAECEQGRFQACLDALKTVLPWRAGGAVEPAEVSSLAASAAEKLKLYDEARGYWEAVVSLAPNDAKAKAGLKALTKRAPPKKKKKP